MGRNVRSICSIALSLAHMYNRRFDFDFMFSKAEQEVIYFAILASGFLNYILGFTISY